MVRPDAVYYDTCSKGIAGMDDGVSQVASTAAPGERNGNFGPQNPRRCTAYRETHPFGVAADKDVGFVHTW